MRCVALLAFGISAEAMANMKKLTYGGSAFVGALCVINVFVHMSHDHHESHASYPYNQMRAKEYPWDASNCDLFNLECKRKFKASQ